jgi:Transposase DDE domain
MAIFDCFFVLLAPSRIDYILADREFVGQDWFKFLLRLEIDFRLRVRKNFRVPNRKGTLIPVCRFFAALPLNVGKSVVRPLRICGCRLWISGMRLASGDYLIVVTPRHTGTALTDYAKRWTIEVLFGCLKSRGFHAEDTHLTKPERIQTLMAVLALAFFWAYRTGQWKHQHKALRVKKPVEKHGRKSKSIFRYGLDELRIIIKNDSTANSNLANTLGLLYGT